MAWSLKKNWLYEGIKLAQYWLLVFSKKDNSGGVKYKYGKNSSQHLYYCPPKGKNIQQSIIFFHGGGWMFGGPKGFWHVASVLLEQGYTVFMVGHRKVPFHNYEPLAADVSNAIAQIKTISKEEGIAHYPTILGGMSSGGHLVASYYFEKKLIDIKALLLIAAPLDLDQMQWSPPLYGLTGSRKQALYKRANTINHLFESDLPVFLCHGTNDAIVEVESSQSFQNQYSALNPNFEYREIKGIGHSEIAFWSLRNNKVRRMILDWLSRLDK